MCSMRMEDLSVTEFIVEHDRQEPRLYAPQQDSSGSLLTMIGVCMGQASGNSHNWFGMLSVLQRRHSMLWWLMITAVSPVCIMSERPHSSAETRIGLYLEVLRFLGIYFEVFLILWNCYPCWWVPLSSDKIWVPFETYPSVYPFKWSLIGQPPLDPNSAAREGHRVLNAVIPEGFTINAMPF